nr:hypothetical protein [Tanacetum cinerariifolium]
MLNRPTTKKKKAFPGRGRWLWLAATTAVQEIKLHMGIWSGLINLVSPALVASPVQSEIPDHERSDPDEHPSDDDDNTISETKEIV